jgi:hypothetical protein
MGLATLVAEDLDGREIPLRLEGERGTYFLQELHALTLLFGAHAGSHTALTSGRSPGRCPRLPVSSRG